MLDQLRTPSWRRPPARRRRSGAALLDCAIDPEEGPYARLERRELRGTSPGRIGELPERERQILALYYEKNSRSPRSAR